MALLALAFFVDELVLFVAFDFAGLFLEDWIVLVGFEEVLVFDGAESGEGEAGFAVVGCFFAGFAWGRGVSLKITDRF